MSGEATIIEGDSVKQTSVTKIDAPPLDSQKQAPQLPSEKGEAIKRPEKFKSDEEVYKAYTELEKEKGRLAKELGDLRAGKKTDTKSETAQDLTVIPAEEMLAKQGIKLADLEAEHAKHGKLTDETISVLEAKGFTRDDINGYIAERTEANTLKAEKYSNEVLKKAGIKADHINDLKEWAGKNLSAAELELFNETVNAGNVDKAAFALKMVDTQFRQAVGREGNMIHGGPTGPAIVGYASDAEMLRDMASKEYDTDPAYRAKVQAKIEASMRKRK